MAEDSTEGLSPRAVGALDSLARDSTFPEKVRHAAEEFRRKQTDQAAADFTKAIKAAEKKIPDYKTHPFKCIGDHDRCLDSGKGSLVCAALLAICLAKRSPK